MLNIIKTFFLSDKHMFIKNGIMLLCYISCICHCTYVIFYTYTNVNIVVNKLVLLRPLCCGFVDICQKLLYVDICLNSLP